MSESGYTQVPNEILDAIPNMKAAEMRLILAISRVTIGWRREGEDLSLTQLQEITGMSRQGVINALEQPHARRFIRRQESGGSYRYSVQVVNAVDQEDAAPAGVVNGVDHQKGESGQRRRLKVVNEVDREVVNAVDPLKEIEGKKAKEREEGEEVIPDSAPAREAAGPPPPPPQPLKFSGVKPPVRPDRRKLVAAEIQRWRAYRDQVRPQTNAQAAHAEYEFLLKRKLTGGEYHTLVQIAGEWCFPWIETAIAEMSVQGAAGAATLASWLENYATDLARNRPVVPPASPPGSARASPGAKPATPPPDTVEDLDAFLAELGIK